MCIGFLGSPAVSRAFYFFALVLENCQRAGGLGGHSGKSEGEKTRFGDSSWAISMCKPSFAYSRYPNVTSRYASLRQ